MNQPAVNSSFNLDDQTRPSWFDRTEKCIDLIREVTPESGRLVISDVGCGDKKLARSLISRGLNIEYRPYDLIPQSSDVRRLDVQVECPDQGSDVVTMLGVAEYLDELHEILHRLARGTRYLIISYTASDFSSYTPERLKELGWRHHKSQAEFEGILTQAGLLIQKCVITDNRRTLLWLCAKSIG
jgi:Hypothetical methyltransferase